MSPTETITILRQFNEWRMGDYEPSEQPEPPNTYEVGLAIDAAIEMIDRLEAAEKDVALKEQVIDALGSELNAVANERDTLRAKIEAMEKQEPVALVESWANGSYSRNYKLQWLRDVNEGARLYALPGAKGE